MKKLIFCIAMMIGSLQGALHIPGMQVGLILDGEVVLSCGYGYRDLEAKLPMTDDSVAAIGSVSKGFITYVLWELVQEGKIGWDDLVVQYIPEFSLKALTICDLAAHRTGMFRHDTLWYFSDRSKLSPREGLEVLSFLEPESLPRTTFHYNNFMYSVLGLIIEKVTGMPYSQAITSRIFEPLGMSRSGFTSHSDNYSLGYGYIDGEMQLLPFQDTPAIAAGGGIYSSASDLLKWANWHLKNYEQFKEMYTVAMPCSEDLGYGLGWYVSKYRGYECVYHAGVVDGFSALVAMLPEKNVALVILANSSSDGLAAIHALEPVIFDQILGLDTKASPPSQKSPYPAPEFCTASNLQDYVGSYTHPAYGLIEIKLIDEELILIYQREIPLLPTSQDCFAAKLSELQKFGLPPWGQVSFSRDPQGMVSEVQASFEAFREGKPITFTK